MAGFAGKFDSVRQDWATPQELFDKVNEEFGFTLDAAASEKNTKAPLYYTESDDALKQDWGCHTVWLNPPYGAKSGSLQDWVRKAWAESAKGATVVMLIPARTNTNWFHEIALGKGEVRFVKGRPKFGDATHGLPQPLCYVIFRPPAPSNDTLQGRGAVVSVLRPFAKLADDFAAVCTHQFGGRGIYGLIPETSLPVGGELAQKTCTISIGDLIAIRDAYNTLQKGTTNAG